ncbi:hypothetical protein BUALT_Bualt16G0025400 [Buddleja alternifolia]|uniref:RING-type E3 ubiquitin transferase n=1 Tax=Buddleja alternifolia TaxID=168488 RepID=A0AAV6WJ43_9LAMI|nr:hypothetical protein BUALT_Bualt16G0025400 [Buddleja alternifolia]
MAEIFSLHRLNHDEYTTSFNFGFGFNAEPENPGPECEDPTCFFYGEDDIEQVNFVADLFESREMHVTEDPNGEMGSGRVEGLGFGFGFGFGPESDSEEFEVNLGFIDNDNDGVDDLFGIDNDFSISENQREDFEIVHFDEREDLNSLIDQIEEMSSEIESSQLGDENNNHEWEVLLAINNLERGFDFESVVGNNDGAGGVHGIDLPGDYNLAMGYDTVFGQLLENENARTGSPPAAKSVVESLPLVVLTKEEAGGDNSIGCAVCKDEVLVGEKLTRMPCCHLYHRECIITWLRIRNTCPVCRYELPTDDEDFDRRRSGRGDNGNDARLVDDLETRYNF